jgi:hypothetical protein
MKATVKKTKREIRAFEDTVTLEVSVKQARILRAILGKNNGSTTSDIYFALDAVLGEQDQMELALTRELPSLKIFSILGE